MLPRHTATSAAASGQRQRTGPRNTGSLQHFFLFRRQAQHGSQRQHAQQQLPSRASAASHGPNFQIRTVSPTQPPKMNVHSSTSSPFSRPASAPTIASSFTSPPPIGKTRSRRPSSTPHTRNPASASLQRQPADQRLPGRGRFGRGPFQTAADGGQHQAGEHAGIGRPVVDPVARGVGDRRGERPAPTEQRAVASIVLVAAAAVEPASRSCMPWLKNALHPRPADFDQEDQDRQGDRGDDQDRLDRDAAPLVAMNPRQQARPAKPSAVVSWYTSQVTPAAGPIT